MERKAEKVAEYAYILQCKHNLPLMLSRSEVAKLLGIATRKVNGLIADKKLVCDNITNKITLYSVAELQCSK